MKIAVYVSRPLPWTQSQLQETFEQFEVSWRTISKLAREEVEGFDMLLIVGSDKDVLIAAHALSDVPIPILGVSDSDEASFLAEATLSNLSNTLRRLLTGDYRVEEAKKLSVSVGSGEELPALNEVAVFPYRSASLMEYTLMLDGELIWRDYSDGVIVATPIGSTAYAMSAGGPLVHPSSPVMLIVSVNSLDVTRKPLVVPDSSVVEIKDISSKYYCEAIVDGAYRIKVSDVVRVVASKGKGALLVKLPKLSAIMDKMSRKVKLADELMKMPPSAKLLLKILEYEGPLTKKEIIKKTMLPDRTVRMSLALLVEKGLVKKQQIPRSPHQLIYSAAR